MRAGWPGRAGGACSSGATPTAQRLGRLPPRRLRPVPRRGQLERRLRRNSRRRRTRPVGRHLPRRRIPRRQQQPHPPRRRTRTPQPGDPAADSGTDNGQPDESPAQAADSENVLSPEQERIHALETENADARHTIADLQEKNAAANQQIADLKADKDELTARLDLIEQHPASNDGYQDRETRRPDHGADGPDGPREENRTRCSTSA
jgi:uncharacterized coiled-coil protein SlyX